MNMIIDRKAISRVQGLAKQFPVVAIIGPRQAGKSTLATEAFPNHRFILLENSDNVKMVLSDPVGFLEKSAIDGVIIDEIQEVPILLNNMLGVVDKHRYAYLKGAPQKEGYFIITGSQHFLVLEKVTQGLPGRMAVLTLLPLSVEELRNYGRLPKSLPGLLIKGFFPEVHIKDIAVQDWMDFYINTCVERDIRYALKAVDVKEFKRFLKQCALRIGNVLDIPSLAKEIGVSVAMINGWISVLETCFIIHLLPPYSKSFSKRVSRSPKLYFYDTGVAAFLLGIKSEEALEKSFFRGALFENFVINEVMKYNNNQQQKCDFYFWRDSDKNEIDLVVERSAMDVVPIEIKFGQNVPQHSLGSLVSWQKEVCAQNVVEPQAYIVSGAEDDQKRGLGGVYSWRNIFNMLDEVYGHRK